MNIAALTGRVGILKALANLKADRTSSKRLAQHHELGTSCHCVLRMTRAKPISINETNQATTEAQLYRPEESKYVVLYLSGDSYLLRVERT